MKRLILFLFTTLLAVGASFAEAPAYKTIPWETAIEMHRKGAVFLDVRTAEEVARGTVAGSLNVPLQELEARNAELPKKKPLLVFCRSGVRSRKASAFLAEKGFTVYNVEGGFLNAPPASAFK